MSRFLCGLVAGLALGLGSMCAYQSYSPPKVIYQFKIEPRGDESIKVGHALYTSSGKELRKVSYVMRFGKDGFEMTDSNNNHFSGSKIYDMDSLELR